MKVVLNKQARKIAINDMKRLNIPTYLLREFHRRRIEAALVKRLK